MKIPVSNQPGPEGRYPQNLYFAPERENGQPALIKTPGLIERAEPEYGAVRGLISWRDEIYAVVGGGLYSIDDDYTVSSKILDIPGDGLVFMAATNEELMVDEQVIDIAGDKMGGSTATTVTSQDGYFIASRFGTEYFYHSAALDGSSWDMADDARAAGYGDNIVAVKSMNRNVWVFGERSVEVYYNTGIATQVFSRISGSTQMIGCISANSIAVGDQSAFWVDNFGRVVSSTGVGGHRVISSPYIQSIIDGYTKTDCEGHIVVWEGHVWYVLTFPTDDKTWVYDTATNFWFQWSSRASGGRYHGNCFVNHKGKSYVGDYKSGKIYQLSGTTYSDAGEEIKCVKVWPTIHDGGKTLSYGKVELHMRVGEGNSYVLMRYSDDPLARHWSSEKRTSIGDVGNYAHRVIFRRMGSAEFRTFETIISSHVPVEIYGLWVNEDE